MKESQWVKCGKHAMFLVSRKIYRCPVHMQEERGGRGGCLSCTQLQIYDIAELGLPYIAVE